MGDVLEIDVGIEPAQIGKLVSGLKAGLRDALAEFRKDAATTAAAVGKNLRSAINDPAIERANETRRQAAKARELLQEQRHQSRLNEIQSRSAAATTAIETRKASQLATIQARSAAQSQTIEQRKVAQIAATNARIQAGEIRHQQRLTEIQARGSKSLIDSIGGVKTIITGILGFATGALFSRIADGFTSLASAALDSAIQVDKSRATLVALLGSTEAANKKLVELRKLANETPGLTASVAVDAFAQLKAIGNITDQTINKVLQGVGRLNAVFSIDDPKGFTRNLVQIFNQGFERSDIKEAIGRVPIFENLLESAFGTKDGDKLRKLKAAGKITLDTFLGGIAESVNNNPTLSKVNESLGGIFDKAKDNITIALAPLGDQIGKLIIPLIQQLGPAVEKFVAIAVPELKDFRDILTDNMGLIRGIKSGLVDLAATSGPQINQFWRLFKEGAESALNDTLIKINLVIRGLNFIAGKTATGLISSATQAGALAGEVFAPGGGGNFGAAIGFQLARDALFGNKKEQARTFKINPGGGGTQVFGGFRAPVAGTQDRFARFLGGADQIAAREEIAKSLAGPDLTKPTGTGGKSAKDRLTEAKQLRTAELDSLKSFEENRINIIQGNVRREIDIIESAYNEQLLSASDFFENKKQLSVFALDQEILSLQTQATKIESILNSEKLTSVEREKLQTRLGDVLSDQIEKSNEILRVTLKNNDALAKTRQLPGTVDLEGLQLPEPAGTFRTPIQEQARKKDVELRKESANAALIENRLDLESVKIQNQINVGLLTEAEGRKAIAAFERQNRDALQSSLAAERERQRILGNALEVGRLDIQIERLKSLGVELTNGQRFLKGFGSEIEDVGDAFDRLGANVSNAFRSTKGLFDGLKQAVKTFFADLLGTSLQTLVKSTLSGVFGPRAGATFGGGGTGGFLTPGFNPNGAGGGFPSALSAILGVGGIGGGGTVSTPRSITGSDALNVAAIIPNLGGGGAAGGNAAGGGILGSILGAFGLNLKGLKTGVGFGLPKGSARGALAGALPFLGASLGSGLGGSSILGQIAGGAGGLLAGIGLTAAPAGAGFLAPLFSNPFTAIAGAGLLVGAILLGKAKQRGSDEAASGEFLSQAIQGINSLAADVAGDRVRAAEAPGIFENQILGTFKQQIGTLKTKSVRESRLTNQVRDLRNLYTSVVVPVINKQLNRSTNSAQIIPEFASGGIVGGRDQGFDSVLSFLRPREMVLTVNHQNAVKQVAGSDIFNRIGVPGAPVDSIAGAPAFLQGGVAARPVGSGFGFGSGPVVIESLSFRLEVGENDATRLFVVGGKTVDGRAVVVSNVQDATLDREL